MKVTTIVAAGFVLGACTVLPKPVTVAPTRSEWGTLLVTTDSLVNAGRYAEADRVLVAFERANAGTRPASEVPFWRALYKLDPRNSAVARAEGLALMDAYADSPTSWWYREHANVLRHLARAIAEAGTPPPEPVIIQGDTSAGGIAARDQVIRDLRADVERLNAELERIKRRLAAPTP